MTAKDTITLPREVVERARKAVVPMAYHTPPYERDEIAAILRAALAAEQPKHEPVATVGTQSAAWKGYDGRWSPPGDPIKVVHLLRDLPLGTLLYTAPPATHPGYIIGSHWLETAYSRICAGEAEADVLRDIGLVREEAFLTGVAHLKAENEALRRDAERWRHWRDSHGFATIDHEGGRCFVTLICDCDDPDQVRAKRFKGEDSFEWLDAFTDAAMKEGKR